MAKSNAAKYSTFFILFLVYLITVLLCQRYIEGCTEVHDELDGARCGIIAARNILHRVAPIPAALCQHLDGVVGIELQNGFEVEVVGGLVAGIAAVAIETTCEVVDEEGAVSTLRDVDGSIVVVA